MFISKESTGKLHYEFLCQVLIKLTKWFQRRSRKCEMFTDRTGMLKQYMYWPIIRESIYSFVRLIRSFATVLLFYRSLTTFRSNGFFFCNCKHISNLKFHPFVTPELVLGSCIEQSTINKINFWFNEQINVSFLFIC